MKWYSLFFCTLTPGFGSIYVLNKSGSVNNDCGPYTVPGAPDGVHNKTVPGVTHLTASEEKCNKFKRYR